eukprot:2515310-Pyramimonas_sp.AAC.1
MRNGCTYGGHILFQSGADFRRIQAHKLCGLRRSPACSSRAPSVISERSPYAPLRVPAPCRCLVRSAPSVRLFGSRSAPRFKSQVASMSLALQAKHLRAQTAAFLVELERSRGFPEVAQACTELQSALDGAFDIEAAGRRLPKPRRR